MANRKIVFFNIGGQIYGLDVVYTQGIERLARLTPVPNTLSHIKGLINLRGEVIPLYSLRKKFGLPEIEATESTQMIITKLNNGISLAFEVDSVQEITEITEKEEEAAPILIMNESTEYIEKVVHLDKQLAILIHPEGILSDMEKESVKSYIHKIKNDAAE